MANAGQFSFVSSHPRAIDRACFKGLAKGARAKGRQEPAVPGGSRRPHIEGENHEHDDEAGDWKAGQVEGQ